MKIFVVFIAVVFFGLPLLVGIIEGIIGELPSGHYTATVVGAHLTGGDTPSIMYMVQGVNGPSVQITHTCTSRYNFPIPCFSGDIIKPGSSVTIDEHYDGNTTIESSSWKTQMILAGAEASIPLAVVAFGLYMWLYVKIKIDRPLARLERIQAANRPPGASQGPGPGGPLGV